MFLTVLAGVAGIVLGFWLGYVAGKRWAAKPGWVYWLLNLGALLIGLTVNVAGLLTGSLPVATGGLALFAGGISGLKYGYGRTLGAWLTVDGLLDAASGLSGGAAPGAAGSYHEVPRDEPGFVSSPLGRDRDVDDQDETQDRRKR